LNVRPVLTEEDKEVKHIIERARGGCRQSDREGGSNLKALGRTGVERQGRYRKDKEDTESSAAGGFC